MLIPSRLSELLDDGIIQEICRPLKSGKEASVFVVRLRRRHHRAAKVYKDVRQRTFRQRADYVEGRQDADSRVQRAMDRGSRFGKQQREESWQSSEATALTRLHSAGVRVPQLHATGDSVLVMDLVLDNDGDPAPQLAHVHFTREQALRAHKLIMQQIARMLCSGLIHADLSEFNILMAFDGPMIIDLPQAVEAVRNNNAKRMLVRDVANVTRFCAKFAPELRRTEYAQEMWLLLEQSALRPDTPLTGRYQAARHTVDANTILREVQAAKAEAARREEIKQNRLEQQRNKAGAAGHRIR